MRFLCSELLILLRCLWFTDTPLCNRWRKRIGNMLKPPEPVWWPALWGPRWARFPQLRSPRGSRGGRVHSWGAGLTTCPYSSFSLSVCCWAPSMVFSAFSMRCSLYSQYAFSKDSGLLKRRHQRQTAHTALRPGVHPFVSSHYEKLTKTSGLSKNLADHMSQKIMDSFPWALLHPWIFLSELAVFRNLPLRRKPYE